MRPPCGCSCCVVVTGEAAADNSQGVGARINALRWGPVDTPLRQQLRRKDPERRARTLVHIRVGRFAELGESANAVLSVPSDESSFVVDGGIFGAYVSPLSKGGQQLLQHGRTYD